MTAAREQEAQEIASAYQVALARLGVASVADAIELWQAVPPTQKAATATRWLNQAVSLMMGHRAQSVALGRAYYRLSRALLTGKTVADPYTPEPQYVTLSTLRSQFEALASAQSPSAVPAGNDTQAVPNAGQDAAQAHENEASEDDDDQILVEEIERLRELEEANEAAAEEELRTVLAALGAQNLEDRVGQIDDSAPATEVDALRQAAHDQAGAQQAAASSRVVMNGARSTTWTMQQGDARAIGWVRVSTTGTPCGWCAMLISRGITYKDGKAGVGTLYGSERSATFDYDDGDKYHDNCHCIAVPVFSTDWLLNSPLFDLNRRYGEQWPTATEGLGGKSALTAWRRFIRTEQAAQKRTGS